MNWTNSCCNIFGMEREEKEKDRFQQLIQCKPSRFILPL
ncbi:MAG: hypothetical protein Metus_0220 [Candidatus Methanosuratincola subterraneus]|uniref:Uncharacterized protein n=1 Tax=Methanosuratincola subterraneus TaxID=2593994 RepID=A0A3S4UHZ4_METS7|nr:MAG: hypothetical protein Metus_0220 [Candidatus Methanosuratincola subterraneus]